MGQEAKEEKRNQGPGALLGPFHHLQHELNSELPSSPRSHPAKIQHVNSSVKASRTIKNSSFRGGGPVFETSSKQSQNDLK